MRAILTYHSIDESGSVISVSESVFRGHVTWLARSAVRVVSIDTLMHLPADANAVALTFDDGFVNFGCILEAYSDRIDTCVLEGKSHSLLAVLAACK